MNEHGYIKSIHRVVKRDFPEITLWKIHDTYAGGVPDAFYTGPEGYIFVEYKYIKNPPKREQTLINLTKPTILSMNQQKWLEDRSRHNISIAVIIGSPTGSIICPDLSWKEPITSRDLRNNIKTADVAQWLADRLGCA